MGPRLTGECCTKCRSHAILCSTEGGPLLLLEEKKKDPVIILNDHPEEQCPLVKLNYILYDIIRLMQVGV